MYQSLEERLDDEEVGCGEEPLGPKRPRRACDPMASRRDDRSKGCDD